MSYASEPPEKKYPDISWTYYDLWLRIEKVFYALPNYFESDIVIKGVNTTDLYAVGSLFSTAIESSVVNILNKTRNVWDANNLYPAYIQLLPLKDKPKPFQMLFLLMLPTKTI